MNDPTGPGGLTNDLIDGLSDAMDALNRSTDRFGETITGAFSRGILAGCSFDEILRSIGQRFVDIALQAALKPATGLLNGLIGSLTGTIGSALGGIKPFADGGVVSSPTYFPMAGQVGLMGEAGPEAVVPLARGADGKLGIRSGGGAGTTVNVSIATQDLSSFRRCLGRKMRSSPSFPRAPSACITASTTQPT